MTPPHFSLSIRSKTLIYWLAPCGTSRVRCHRCCKQSHWCGTSRPTYCKHLASSVVLLPQSVLCVILLARDWVYCCECALMNVLHVLLLCLSSQGDCRRFVESDIVCRSTGCHGPGESARSLRWEMQVTQQHSLVRMNETFTCHRGHSSTVWLPQRN